MKLGVATMEEKGVLKLQLSRGKASGALNRCGNHEHTMNPTATVVWFPPARNVKGEVGQAREHSVKVME